MHALSRLNPIVLCLMLCLLTSVSLHAQQHSKTPAFSEAGITAIEAYFGQYISDQKLPGVTFALSRRGEPIVMQSIGFQDTETGAPATDSTIYRIASMTKIVTSVAVMQLVEQGKIALDAPVSDYIPELRNTEVATNPQHADGPTEPATEVMTVKHLLMHTSGLGGSGVTGINGRYGRIMGNPAMNLQEKMQAIGELPLLYQPGTQWRYSMATTALGYLVEVVSGIPFDRYLDEQIFTPLGMVDTGFYVPASRRHRVMSIYRASEDPAMQRTRQGLGNHETRLPNAPNGGGGLFSTVPDYLRFAHMLLNEGTLDGSQILKPETVQLMTRDHLPAQISLPEQFGRNYGLAGYGFGLGVRVRTDVARSGLPGNIGEYGWGGLFETYVIIDPAASLVAVYMTQVRPSSFYPLRRDFTRLVYEALPD